MALVISTTGAPCFRDKIQVKCSENRKRLQKDILFGNKCTNLLVVVDDYSSSFITVDLIQKPTVENMTEDIDTVILYRNAKPGKFLADNGLQFNEQFKNGAMEMA